MAAVAIHRFISWPPHWDEDGRILAVTAGLGCPHPTGVVYGDWSSDREAVYPVFCIALGLGIGAGSRPESGITLADLTEPY